MFYIFGACQCSKSVISTPEAAGLKTFHVFTADDTFSRRNPKGAVGPVFVFLAAWGSRYALVGGTPSIL